MHDRSMQALYLMALIPISEQTADPNSYGFRVYRSTADAMEQCFRVLSRKTSAQWIFEADIVGCFDQISHDWLISHVPTDKEVLRKWLKAGYIDQGKLYPTQSGTPQGGIVSPTVANLALDGLEQELMKFPRSQKVHFVRFADDFVVTGSSKDFLEWEVRPVVEAFLRERGLELSKEKTQIVQIGEGFDFLGANVRKYGGKLLIKPADKNTKAFLGKIRDTLNGAKAATQNQVIAMLNPIIRGWSNFHRHIVAKSTFARVDHEIQKMLWNWASRRHSDKGKGWIKDRYFPRRGSREWAFTDPREKGPELARASDTPIKRHIKIKMDANPFDPKWTTYFEDRRSRAEHNRNPSPG